MQQFKKHSHVPKSYLEIGRGRLAKLEVDTKEHITTRGRHLSYQRGKRNTNPGTR